MRKLLFFSLLCIANVLFGQLPFNKVIIWGHKLHSHTHSYIHWGFYRAFNHLGYETHWIDNNDLESCKIDFSNALFITEGQVDQKIPVRDDCLYILHNCTSSKYKSLVEKKRAITLQVYTHDVLPRPVTKIDTCLYYSIPDQVLYMPWATDLLPHEIDEMKKKITLRNKENIVYFVGSTGYGQFGNKPELNQFERAANMSGIKMQYIRKCSMEDNIHYIQRSFIAPAIQGAWQCKQGYIPCRIFKNISYGQFGVTNSKAVYDLFEGKIVYNPDAYALFNDAQKKINSLTLKELHELMDLVKTKHTYINRINTLLWLLEEVYSKKGNILTLKD